MTPHEYEVQEALHKQAEDRRDNYAKYAARDGLDRTAAAIRKTKIVSLRAAIELAQKQLDQLTAELKELEN